MRPLEKIEENILLLTPVFGTIVFVLLYFIASFFYPGGSLADKNSIGFSWMNNFWCNLLSENAINGQQNSARPIGIAAMFVLCATLSFFWLTFPRHLRVRSKLKPVIQVAGILAMTTSLFLFTDFNHDTITNLASFFGLIATVGSIIVLYRAKWTGLYLFGLANMVLIGVNNYVYHSKGIIHYLPLIQKISFAAFLVWICLISITIYLQARQRPVVTL